MWEKKPHYDCVPQLKRPVPQFCSVAHPHSLPLTSPAAQVVCVRVSKATAEAVEGTVRPSSAGARVHGADAYRCLSRHVSLLLADSGPAHHPAARLLLFLVFVASQGFAFKARLFPSPIFKTSNG